MILVQIARQRALTGDEAGAIDALARAADLGRNQADAAAFVAGYSMMFGGGNVGEAEGLLQCAFRLNPTPPAWYKLAECRVAFCSGNYERAEKVTFSAPDYLSVYLFRALSQAQLGKRAEAKVSYEALKAKFKAFDFNAYAAEFPMTNDSIRRYREGVEKLMRVCQPARQESCGAPP